MTNSIGIGSTNGTRISDVKCPWGCGQVIGIAHPRIKNTELDHMAVVHANVCDELYEMMRQEAIQMDVQYWQEYHDHA